MARSSELILGSNSANGQYGIPTDNPYANDGDPTTLGEIYAGGARNPQRFGWDVATGNFSLADIGQSRIEEISRATSGANLGWNDWEGSYFFAITGLVVYRNDAIPQLNGFVLFGDNPSGELFATAADDAATGGQGAIRRVLLSHEGAPTTLLALIQATNAQQGRRAAPRADLRLGVDGTGRVFVLNKYDGVIRVLVRTD